jgi:HJR/Mrr/RecB family endonuclease
MDDLLEVTKTFSRASKLARELHHHVERFSWQYRYWHLTPGDQQDRIDGIKYVIYWLQHNFEYRTYDGKFHLSLADLQTIEALHATSERALPTLVRSCGSELLHEGELWTPLTIPQGVLIALNDVSRELLRKLAATPQIIHDLSPRRFEEVIAMLLEKDGFEVQLTPPSKDGGRDILAFLDLPVGRILTLVECKKWSPGRKVSVEPVRQLYGVLAMERASNAMLATTSTFTKDARLFVDAVKYQLSLKDYADITHWLQKPR